MKTKEQWVTEYEAQRYLPRNQRTLIHSNGSYIEAVQLDAFKAGAEWAAKRVGIFGDTMEIQVHSELLQLTSERVKSMATNLKEIPK